MVLGEKLKLHIEAATGTGDGIAHADGFVVFVRGAVRGDLCMAEVDRVTRRASFCHITELLSPSPERVAPDCPHANRCGGCPSRHMTYPEELRAKAEHVRNCLRRIGGWDAEPDRILAAPSRDGYRNKALLRYDAKAQDFGFCEAGSHTPVPGKCRALLSADETDLALELIAAHCRQTGYIPYGLLVRRSLYHGDLLLAILADTPVPEEDALIKALTAAVPSVTGIVRCPAPQKGGVGIGRDPELIYGTPHIRERLMGIDFTVAPAAFFQVNTLMAEKLYNTAADYIREAAPTSVLDLYCGIGSIGLCITPPKTRLIGVEIVPAAVECANENAAACGRDAEFIAADAGDAAAELDRRGEKPELIILDPPRKGLSEELCALLCKMAPPHLLYISCDPATLARDIARLSGTFTPQKYSVADLFPGTDHIETVALLSRQINVHKMKLNSTPFKMIKSGEKTIELRLFDEKRQQVKTGDKIVFTNNANGEILNTTVVKLHRFDSFKELYKSLPLLKCGYTTENVDKATPSDMEQYYSVEEQRKYGVVGIELCRPEQITDESIVTLIRE